MRNEINYQLKDTLIAQSKGIVRNRKNYFAIVLMIFSLSSVCSQTDRQRSFPKDNLEVIETPKIFEVQAYIQYLKSNEISNNLSYSSSDRLIELLFKPQSSIYFYSGVNKVFGEKVTNLYTDVTSLNAFGFNQKYNNVEIITIYINTVEELNGIIDLNLFKDLKKLKFVYIIGKPVVNENQIFKMVRNLDFKYGVFYKIPRDDNY